MGNCFRLCCGGDDDSYNDNDGRGRNKKSPGAFSGQGNRLGTADEAAFGSGQAPATAPIIRDDSLPEPVHDANLDDAQRARIREDRAAAAEARLKKQGGGGKRKKKPNPDAQPLRGPNSANMMTWTVGN
mmetsp:Transcript_27951/g.41376  ORF Transcript_27951/g.41376 Transcript_27951/m.41376 type:complete len:129 (-) Transcript_27951:218-604(-)